jgi:MFS transporter, DHA1 family, multidrug resistance protein
MRGLAASLQNFVQMLLFALVSGFIAPLLFDSSIKLALGQMSAVLLASFFWWLASRQGSVRSAREVAKVA